MKRFGLLLTLLVVLGLLGNAHAVTTVIDFTGGNVIDNEGITGVTNMEDQFFDVDQYIEDGFIFDFVTSSANDLSGIVGNFFPGNDGLYGHWATGQYGSLTEIRVARENGELFDLDSIS